MKNSIIEPDHRKRMQDILRDKPKPRWTYFFIGVAFIFASIIIALSNFLVHEEYIFIINLVEDVVHRKLIVVALGILISVPFIIYSRVFSGIAKSKGPPPYVHY